MSPQPLSSSPPLPSPPSHSHSIAVVSPQSSDDPAHYLNPEDRIMPIKGEAAADAMFVLCIHSPGPAILEIVNTIRQNVSPPTLPPSLPLSLSHPLSSSSLPLSLSPSLPFLSLPSSLSSPFLPPSLPPFLPPSLPSSLPPPFLPSPLPSLSLYLAYSSCVLFPSPSLLMHTLIHSFTHSLIHSFTHTLIHSFTHTLIHT